ncbi:MAG TPA: glycine cleavage system aminomethyltransferase GcvT [Candidatus Krumholzibacteria bacterium]|nr:glycine cleavage system aminomethyltransferase GcvT [Candidatus Krumholzibacteria bacterium]HRX50342.1 glycine cleavage system aminomethyltransferase GcvT [Candidatus Krumholzibacteria bacterium]
MAPASPQDLKQTPLTAWHRENGGRMVEYAGFEMPVQYRGVLAEHAAVRQGVGLFDITHMGEILVSGAGAGAWLDGLATNRVLALPLGGVVYTAMCREDGGVLDDMLIYRLDVEEWMVVCNAANHAKIAAWLQARLAGAERVAVRDVSDATALIAVQGPAAAELMARVPALAGCADAVAALDFYTCAACDGPGGRWIVSRTGYTGERGYELYVPVADALALWETLLAQGADLGAEPIGLAARDTLRFEVAYCLYGHELAEDVTPLEAGIGWAVRLKDRAFVGRDALAAQKAAGVPRRLVGLEVLSPVEGRPAPIARQDAEIFVGERRVGAVTSGTKSPTLDRPLAMALIAADAIDAELEVDIRGRRAPVRTVPLPFLPARVKGDPRAER